MHLFTFVHTVAPDNVTLKFRTTVHVWMQRSGDNSYIKTQLIINTAGISAPYWSDVGRLSTVNPPQSMIN